MHQDCDITVEMSDGTSGIKTWRKTYHMLLMNACNQLSYMENAVWKIQLHIIKISVKLNNCNSPFEILSSLVASFWSYAKEAHNAKGAIESSFSPQSRHKIN